MEISGIPTISVKMNSLDINKFLETKTPILSSLLPKIPDNNSLFNLRTLPDLNIKRPAPTTVCPPAKKKKPDSSSSDTDALADKVAQRKQQNRIAAHRSREKKKSLLLSTCDKASSLETENKKLKDIIAKQNETINNLMARLEHSAPPSAPSPFLVQPLLSSDFSHSFETSAESNPDFPPVNIQAVNIYNKSAVLVPPQLEVLTTVCLLVAMLALIAPSPLPSTRIRSAMSPCCNLFATQSFLNHPRNKILSTFPFWTVYKTMLSIVSLTTHFKAELRTRLSSDCDPPPWYPDLIAAAA